MVLAIHYYPYIYSPRQTTLFGKGTHPLELLVPTIRRRLGRSPTTWVDQFLGVYAQVSYAVTDVYRHEKGHQTMLFHL
jgi:hypothetical protein